MRDYESCASERPNSDPFLRRSMQQSSAGVRPRPRIETLADLVFGLSLSIGSIALIANPPKSAGEITTHILAFAYTFFVLITAWLIYTTYMSV